MVDVANFRALLAKIEAIGIKYAGVAEKGQYDFNVFSILRKSHEEVGLHSAFLKTLFDPKGGHGQGAWLLNRFLKRVGIEPVGEDTSVQVITEHTRLRHTDEGKKRDSIDIYILSGNRAIVIENKIYAGDQPRQIQRYVEFVEEKGASQIDVIYLTLDGRDPTKESLGNIPKELVKCRSYLQHVDPWLSECIEHMARHPTTRETLVLYQRIVREITGKSLNEEETMEITEQLLDSAMAFSTGMKVTEAMDQAKAKAQLLFWTELEEALKNDGFTEKAILGEGTIGQKYTPDLVNSYYVSKRNRPWYGIKIFIGNLNARPDLEIFFYIEVDWSVFYGFIIQEANGDRVSDHKMTGGIRDALHDSYESNKWWPAWRYPRRENGSFDLEINFKQFNDPAINLVDHHQRKSYVAKLAMEIKEAIHEGATTLKDSGLLTKEAKIWKDADDESGA